MTTVHVLADRRHPWAFSLGADGRFVYGRRASILLSAVMFVGTSLCGAMPSFWWNVGMCFLMGAAAGGMLPVTYALLAETMPSRQHQRHHRHAPAPRR